MFMVDYLNIHWFCKHTWLKASHNTLWCLLGCSIGDLGTILYFQLNNIEISVLYIMILAIINGLITSVILETIILCFQMNFYNAFKTAIGMSFISMIAMEIAMNTTDFIHTGGAIITFEVLPLILFFGFITPLPYNYWRLKYLRKSCH